MRELLLTTLSVCILAWSCVLPEEEPPTSPEPVSQVPPSTSVVPSPAASPTPDSGVVLGTPSRPEPSPEEPESPTSPPASSPSSSECGAPTPPPLSRIKVTIHLQGPAAWTLDATPLVGPDPEYCELIGFTDGRQFCPVRPEGDSERVACETFLVGEATDTGRPGPTWRRNGALCTGPASGCENHGENQYLLRTFASGTYTACATNGLCGELAVDR